MGKQQGIYHRYIIKASDDAKTWRVIVDKSQNKSDVPHDYVELKKRVTARFIRIENIHMPTGKFALSGLRVFGKTDGKVPDTVKHFVGLRGESERRNVWFKWQVSDEATGYTIYTGETPDKLYNAITLYGVNEYYFTGMERDKPYYFQIEAFNESGIGNRTAVMKVE
jgi:hypothetical protein